MKRSEIWLINLDPTIGAEIRKIRPAVIVNDDALGILPLKVIVPITDWKDRYSTADWMVKLDPDSSNNLTKVSAADCFQVRSLSQTRMVRKLGEVTNITKEKIEGVWNLEQLKIGERKYPAEETNNCNYKEEITIKITNSIDTFSKLEIIGRRIGKTNYKICKIDPITYEYGISSNDCYNSLFQDIHHENKWYEIGEGTFVEYDYRSKGNKIILEEVDDKLDQNGALKILTLKKSGN